jgi:hypothetical protein
MNSKNKNIEELRTRSKKDENSNLFADSHNILNRSDNYFSQLLNVYSVSDVRQTEILIVEPLVHDSRLLRLKLLLQSWESINR